MKHSLTADHKLRKQRLEQSEGPIGTDYREETEHTLASTFLTHVIFWDGNQSVFIKKVQMIIIIIFSFKQYFVTAFALRAQSAHLES